MIFVRCKDENVNFPTRKLHKTLKVMFTNAKCKRLGAAALTLSSHTRKRLHASVAEAIADAFQVEAFSQNKIIRHLKFLQKCFIWKQTILCSPLKAFPPATLNTKYIKLYYAIIIFPKLVLFYRRSKVETCVKLFPWVLVFCGAGKQRL